jgi:hypothetical protein
MKLTIFGAVVALTLPLSAMAQSLPQKRADLEEALRVRQFICNGIADVNARGGSEYSADDLARCRSTLDAQRAEYQRFLADYASAAPAPTVALPGGRNRTTFADAAH